MTSRTRGFALLAVVTAAVLTFVLAAVHEHGEAARRLDAANAALSQQQWRGAIDNAHAAALRALPRSALQRESFLLLERTGRAASIAGDTPSSLYAWTAMRHAAIATRSFVSDTSAWQREADDAIRASSGGSVESITPAGGPPSYGFRALTGAVVVAAAIVIAWLTRTPARRSEP